MGFDLRRIPFSRYGSYLAFSHLAADPDFATNADRIRHRDLVDAVLGGWFAARESGEALEAMRAAGATVGPIYSIADAMADPHFQAREVFVDLEDSEFGSLAMHNVVPRLADASLKGREVGELRGKACAGLPPGQLYDLASDIGERRNVQAEHPETVARLTALLARYVRDGRSTPGAPQPNTGPARWPQLAWMADDFATRCGEPSR